MLAQRLTRTREEPAPGSALLIVVIALPLSLVALLILAADRGEDFLAFGALALCFLALAGTFLFTNGSVRAQWCTAPGFMTIIAAIFFVIVPFARFAAGDDQVDTYYLRAMVYLLLGFSMFWIACWLLKRPHNFAFVPELQAGSPRILVGATALFLVGLTAKVVLWQLGILGYMAATLSYNTDISAVGTLDAAGQMLTMAMLISGIEVFGKHSQSLGIRVVFVLSLTVSLGFGLISGMKLEVLMPLFALTMMLGIIRKRLPRLVWLLPLIFILIQPFVNAYRRNLNTGYSAQINTVGGLADALTKSVEDVGSSQDSIQKGSNDLSVRFSDLTLFHNVLQLPSPTLLNGDETVWMAPLYPFIPRLLWKDKPIFNKGQRMSEAMGIGKISSTNVPGIADLYALGGTAGLLIGMFVWGALLQTYMNSIGSGMSEKGLFLYLMILVSITTIERDIVAMIGGVVQGALIYLVLSKMVYGGRLFGLRAAPAWPREA
jgi:hypothetical protein